MALFNGSQAFLLVLLSAPISLLFLRSNHSFINYYERTRHQMMLNCSVTSVHPVRTRRW